MEIGCVEKSGQSGHRFTRALLNVIEAIAKT